MVTEYSFLDELVPFIISKFMQMRSLVE